MGQVISRIEAIRDRAKKEYETEDAAGHLMGCIRNMEAFELELDADGSTLKGIHLDGAASGAPQQIAQLFELEREVDRAMEDACAQLVQGPRAGVDPGTLTAQAPKLTAQLDYLDRTISRLRRWCLRPSSDPSRTDKVT